MATFFEAIENATRASICSVLAGAEAASWAGDALVPPWIDNPVPDTVRKARLAACSNPDPIVDLPQPPFLGGQCECFRYQYRVQWKASWNAGFVTSSTTVRARGPVASVSGRGFQNRAVIDVECRGALFNDQSSWPACVALSSFSYSVSVAPPGSTVTETEITAVTLEAAPDGDSCGDLPVPDPPPYSPITITQNLTYVDNSETTVNEDGDFTVWAPVIIGGNLIAPVTVDVGGVSLNGELNIETGDFNFNFGIPSGGPNYEDIPIDNPEPEEEEPSSDIEVFYGLQVFSYPSGTAPAVTSSWQQANAPTLQLPRTANVWFIVPIGASWGWIGPIVCQHANQIVMVPHGLPAIDHRVVPNTGWEVEVNRLGKPDCGCNPGNG